MGGSARSKWDTPLPLPQTPVQKQTHETERTAQVMVDLFGGLVEEWRVVIAGKPLCPPSTVSRAQDVHPSRPCPCVGMLFLEPAAAVLSLDPGEGNGRNHYAAPSAELSMNLALQWRSSWGARHLDGKDGGRRTEDERCRPFENQCVKPAT